MQQPQRNTPVGRCETAAHHSVHAFRRYIHFFKPASEVAARLESLAATLEGATDVLVRAQGEYRAAVLALIAHRVEVKLVDLVADELVRSVKRAADEAGKDVSTAVFPEGVTPIVKPVGQTEVEALRALEGRISATTRWQGREAVAARVQAVRTEYEAALVARKAGMTAAADEGAARDAAKEDFLDVFARVTAAVKELFPRDRARQNVFFDVIRERSAAADDVESVESDESDEAPAE